MWGECDWHIYAMGFLYVPFHSYKTKCTDLIVFTDLMRNITSPSDQMISLGQVGEVQIV